MGEEGTVAVASEFLRTEEGKDDGAARPGASGEDVSEGEDRGGAGCVVVGSVVVGVASGVGGADAEVVEVCGEEDDLVGRCGAAEDGDGVPGLFTRNVLEPRDALLCSCW